MLVQALERRRHFDGTPYPFNGMVVNNTDHVIYILTDEFDPNDSNNSYDTDGDGQPDTGWRPLQPGETSGTFEDVDAGYDPELPGDDSYHVPAGMTLEFGDLLTPVLFNSIWSLPFDDDLQNIPPDRLDETYGAGVDLPEFE